MGKRENVSALHIGKAVGLGRRLYWVCVNNFISKVAHIGFEVAFMAETTLDWSGLWGSTPGRTSHDFMAMVLVYIMIQQREMSYTIQFQIRDGMIYHHFSGKR